MASKEDYAPPSPDSFLNLRYAGEEACLPGHRFGGVRDHVLFHYILRGEGQVRIDGSRFRLKAGAGFVFFAGQEHEYRASTHDPWHYVWMGFSGTGAVSILSECGIIPGRSIFELPLSEALVSQFRRARAHLGEGSPLSPLAADACLRLALTGLASMHRTALPTGITTSRPGIDYVEAARIFMEEHFVHPIDTSDVARHIGLDRRYLSELFSRRAGTSLKAYLTNLRMEKARFLLASSGLGVAQVAASVGFRDASVFSRRFRLENGLSPSECRPSPLISAPPP